MFRACTRVKLSVTSPGTKVYQIPELPYNCCDTPHVNNVDGHLVVTKPAHLRALFGSQASIMLHD